MAALSTFSRFFNCLGRDTVGREAWDVGSELGRGSAGVVYRVENRITQVKGAMKVIDYDSRSMTPEAWATLRERTIRETKILRLLDHPNIVKLYDFFDWNGSWCLVIELVHGGNLVELIQNHPDGKLPEEQARGIFSQIVTAMKYCHAHRVVHRDLKLENILIDQKSNLIKITDFGFADFFDEKTCLKSCCGSPMYAAPEIYLGIPYRGPPLDAWSLGVLLFCMLAGAFPWTHSKKGYNLGREVISGRFELPGHISPVAQGLIKRLLVVNSDDRPSMDDILGDPWMKPELDKIESVVSETMWNVSLE